MGLDAARDVSLAEYTAVVKTRRAADEIGVQDPDSEWRRWLEEGMVGR
jgi:hypothetical protein